VVKDTLTNRERIINQLKELAGPVCDDCLATLAGISPRQTVNQICNSLSVAGQITRGTGNCIRCGKTKKVNQRRGPERFGPSRTIMTKIEEEKESESDIRDLIMWVLHYRLGRLGSWADSGQHPYFELGGELSGYRCLAEGRLSYLIAGTEISHATDILISSNEKERHVSIEIKYRSAVTDQFKCRSYDMIHLKKEYGDKLFGVMVYVKSPEAGISVERAKAICYPFDYFFSVTASSINIASSWDDLVARILDFLREG